MEQPQKYDEMLAQTGVVVAYEPNEDGAVTVRAIDANGAMIAEAKFAAAAIDEAHILFMEATELLSSRVKLKQDLLKIRELEQKLFALFRGEKVLFEDVDAGATDAATVATKKPERKPSGEFVANPGKQIEIYVDGTAYERLPVRTRLITMRDADIVPLIDDYVKPYVRPGDAVYVSEKALTITQGRVVDMSSIKPSRLARFLARNVGTQYGTTAFHGFGHGTTLAMQLFIEEAGYLRVLFAAAVSAITRPFGVRGMFYRICGKRAKSIDCPMSFLILEYAHSAKLAPNDPSGAARRIQKTLGGAGTNEASTAGWHDVIILDANYRGAFSLGKTRGAPSEDFIGKLFRDNPLGQSDEMTPFCIVRKK